MTRAVTEALTIAETRVHAEVNGLRGWLRYGHAT
jgi:hypothetical protein